MLSYILYSLAAMLLATLFSMGGSGAGIALIPILNFMGVDFTIAKAAGLFAGATTTMTASAMNLKRKAVDFKLLFPLASMMLIFAPLGAYCSQYVDKEILKSLFMILLFYSATMMLFGKKKSLVRYTASWVLFAVGAIVGFLAGILGVGGGNILIPFLTFLGFESKKVAITVSFVVPFSALGSFATYASYLQLDWILIASVAVGAMIGGYIGNYLMYFKLKQEDIKKVMALLLYILAFKLLFHFLPWGVDFIR